MSRLIARSRVVAVMAAMHAVSAAGSHCIAPVAAGRVVDKSNKIDMTDR